MTQPHRLAAGGHVDRATRLSFTFDGRRYEGHGGDTLAAALLANGGTDAEGANTTDRATEWLNGNSCGSGPFRLVRWERTSQIVLAPSTASITV